MRLLTDHADAVTAVAFSPDGAWLASADVGGSILLRDALALTVTRAIHPDEQRRRRPVSSVAFTPDGRHLIAAYRGNARRDARWVLGRWEVAGGPPEILRRGLGREPAVGFAPDGRKFYAVHRAGTNEWIGCEILRWALPRWRAGVPVPIWSVNTPRTGPWPAMLSIDGPIVLAGLRNSPDVALLQSDVRGVYHVWAAHPTAARGLALLPGGRRCLTAGPNQVRLWRVPEYFGTGEWQSILFGNYGEDPERLGEWRREGSPYVSCLALSPDGRTAAVGRNGGLVNLLDVDSLSTAATFRWPLGNVTALAFAPDGLRLAAGGENGTAVVWDID